MKSLATANFWKAYAQLPPEDSKVTIIIGLGSEIMMNMRVF